MPRRRVARWHADDGSRGSAATSAVDASSPVEWTKCAPDGAATRGRRGERIIVTVSALGATRDADVGVVAVAGYHRRRPHRVIVTGCPVLAR